MKPLLTYIVGYQLIVFHIETAQKYGAFDSWQYWVSFFLILLPVTKIGIDALTKYYE